jgi:hypothetical protein
MDWPERSGRRTTLALYRNNRNGTFTDVTKQAGLDGFTDATDMAQAYFDCVNANGGINGRPIDFKMEDDQTRPDKAAELAKKLVEDHKAVALIGSSSLVDCIATAQYYEQTGIVSLMAGAVAPHCFAGRNIAMMNAGPRYGGLGVVKYAVEKLGARAISIEEAQQLLDNRYVILRNRGRPRRPRRAPARSRGPAGRAGGRPPRRRRPRPRCRLRRRGRRRSPG